MASQTVLTYDCGWAANVMGWCNDESKFRLGVGSYLKKYANAIDIVERDVDSGQLVCKATAEHSYPATKLMFAPSSHRGNDIFITTGDYLRVWNIEPKEATAGEGDVDAAPPAASPEGSKAKEGDGKGGFHTAPLSTYQTSAKSKTVDHTISFKTLNNNKSEFCSPLTSCDWNQEDPSIVGVSSIDTTVAIWDLNKETLTTQLIAHEKEVYDIAFAKGTTIFSTCGADGSLRVFDTREMEHCTIVFEAPELKPLLRCAWNKLEGTYISTFTADGNVIHIVDVRYPSIPIATLQGHTGAINSMMWAPSSATHLCSAGEDKTALIWDWAGEQGGAQAQVMLSYNAGDSEINNVGWSVPRGPNEDNWVGITCGDELRALKV